MSTLTLLTAIVLLIGLVLKDRYPIALALAGIPASGAVFVSGRVALPAFYAAAVIATILYVVPRVLGRAPAARVIAGLPQLLLFFGYATVITLIAPVLFDGLPTVVPAGGQLTAGALTTSNAAQAIYLLLGIGTVAFLASSRPLRPGLIGVTLVGATVLSTWRYLSISVGLPFPEGVFDNSPVFTYIESAPGNIPRFRGIFSEPAGLAGSSLATIAWGLASLPRSSPRGVAIRLAAVAAATFLGVTSTSTTFIVAGAISIALAVLVLFTVFIGRQIRVPLPVATVGLILSIFALFAVPTGIGFVQNAVSAKVGTASYDDRTNLNALLYGAFSDSFGLGVGLGAGRASSFIATLVGTTGVVGVALFSAAVVVLLKGGIKNPDYRPVAWTLAVVLITKSISGPDLSDSSGILWITLGLLGQAIANQNELKDKSSGLALLKIPPTRTSSSHGRPHHLPPGNGAVSPDLEGL